MASTLWKVAVLTAIVFVAVSECQLRTDDVEPTIVIQPPLVQSINPAQSFNDSQKLFDNVGLYLFKRKIHIEEFYYAKDNSSVPPDFEQVNASSTARMASMVQTTPVHESRTPPPPPTPGKMDMLSFVAKRELEAEVSTSAPATVPSTSPSTQQSTTTKPTTAFQPFSFSVTSMPMRQPVNSASGTGTFRLPSILDRFRRPSTNAPPAVASFFLTLSTTAPTTPSTTMAPITPSTTTTSSTTVQQSAPLVALPQTQQPPQLQPITLQQLPAIQLSTAPQPTTTTTPPPVPTLTINSTVISEINNLALSRKRFRFKDLSSGEFLNETTPECRKQLRMTDTCLKRVMLISSDAEVPRTEGQLNETYCNNMNTTLKCLGGYSKCLSRVPRIMYNFVYLSMKKQLLELCNSGPVRNQLILHSNCFQNETDKKVLRDVSSRGTLTAVYVLQHVPANQVIQWGCCGFFKMFEDGKRAIDNLCTKRTGSMTGKWIMDLVMKSAADLLEIGCLRYSSVKSCRQHLPAAIETFEALTAGDIPDQKYSPVIPLIEIARKLGGEF